MFGRKPRGSSEGVLVAADQAMYTAKQGGRDRIALFRDPSESQQPAERIKSTTARIRDALTHNRLSFTPSRSAASPSAASSATSCC